MTVIVTKPPSSMIRCRNTHILYLCENMRADEREQFCALRGDDHYEPDAASAVLINLPGLKFTTLDEDGYPAAAGGYHEVAPGVWQSWMVGSESGWTNHWRSITKGSRWLMDQLFAMGARRLQTNVLAKRTQACQWYIDGLKMQYEGTRRQFCPNGEDIAEYARLARPVPEA